MNKSFEDIIKELNDISQKNKIGIEIKYSTNISSNNPYFIISCNILQDNETLIEISRSSSIDKLRYNIEEMVDILNNNIN